MKSPVHSKRILLVLITIVVIVMSPVSVVYGQLPPQYWGHVFEGAYLRVGLNDYGVLGIEYEGWPYYSVGFQYPKGSAYESLATGWWGDGWSVFYDEAYAGFSPDDGPWGTIEDVIPDKWLDIVKYGYIKTCVITTNDEQLEITFKFGFMYYKKYLILIMFIKNIGLTTIEDLEVKKIVDWDVWYPTIDDYGNYWGMDNIRKPNMNLAVAFINSSLYEGSRPIYMGFASREKPTDYDLNWDDYYTRGIYEPTKVSLSYKGKSPWLEDGCPVYQWLLGNLKPGETKVLHFVYAAGDSLEELEKNVAQGFKMAVTIR
ncbi:MAG: hypothetical protein QXJ17_08430 [Nitrososphaeria archaeon]